MIESAIPDLKFTFPKEERLYSKKLIEELFKEGSYFYLYPFRVTYLYKEDLPEYTQAMFSVSKKKFKSAVKRNRIKRLLKESYRLNKHIISNRSVVLAFVYTSDELPDFKFAQKRMLKAINKLNKLEG